MATNERSTSRVVLTWSRLRSNQCCSGMSMHSLGFHVISLAGSIVVAKILNGNYKTRHVAGGLFQALRVLFAFSVSISSTNESSSRFSTSPSLRLCRMGMSFFGRISVVSPLCRQCVMFANANRKIRNSLRFLALQCVRMVAIDRFRFFETFAWLLCCMTWRINQINI